jgi:hypothetical protein
LRLQWYRILNAASDLPTTRLVSARAASIEIVR